MQVPTISDESIRTRFAISYNSSTTYKYSAGTPGEQMSHTLTYLMRDTVYSIRVRVDFVYSECGYEYLHGNSSDPLMFRTNATSKFNLKTL